MSSEDYKAKLPAVEERVLGLLGLVVPPMPKSFLGLVPWLESVRCTFVDSLLNLKETLSEDERQVLRDFTTVEGEDAFSEWGKSLASKLLKKRAMEAYPGWLGQAVSDSIDAAYPD